MGMLMPMPMPIGAEQQLGRQEGAHACEHGDAQLEDWVGFVLVGFVGLVAAGRTRKFGALNAGCAG